MRNNQPTGIRWLVLGLACFTSWLLYLHRYAWGVIKPDVRKEFDLSLSQTGWIDFAFNATYALSQVPTGLAGDLWGPALVLPISIALWSFALILMVLGVGTITFCSIRALFGVTQAGAYPNLAKVTRSWFPVSSRSAVQGLIASFSGRMGGACSPLIVGSLLMGLLHLGWRETLLILGGFGICFAILFRVLFANSPQEHRWANKAEQDLIEAEEPHKVTTGKLVFDWSGPVRLSFIFLMAQIFLSAFADQLFVNWIFTFLEEEKGLTKEAMGFYGSLPLFGGAIGGLAAGFLIDALYRGTGKQRFSRSAVGFVGKILSAILVLYSVQFADPKLMMVVVAVGKFFTDWSQPAMWAATTDISGRAAGRVFGIINMAGSIGAAVAGPIIGEIIESFGWNALFWTIAGVYLLAAFTWLFIDPTKRLVIEQGTPKSESTT